MLLSEEKGGTGQVDDAESETGEVPSPEGPWCGHRGREGKENRVAGDMVSAKFKGQESDLRDTERMGRSKRHRLCGQTFLKGGAGLGVERDVRSRSVLVQLLLAHVLRWIVKFQEKEKNDGNILEKVEYDGIQVSEVVVC